MDDLVANAMCIANEELAACTEKPDEKASNSAGVVAVPKLGYLVDVDPSGANKPRPRKIDDCFRKSAAFRQVALSARIRAVVAVVQEAQATAADKVQQSMVNAEPLLCVDQAFMKPPHFGSRKPYHQDNYYFQCSPADDTITCWLALDDADVANGCLHYITGSHKQGLSEHGTIPGDPNESNLSPSPEHIKHCIDLAEAENGGRRGVVAAVVPKGGVVLHHSLTLHCSEANTSDRWRRGYATHWVTPRVTTTSESTLKDPLFATQEWQQAVRTAGRA
jgi:ectoine hydroxylase-related dioxygenase (phytanoyl-CoA dioxygenase family)